MNRVEYYKMKKKQFIRMFFGIMAFFLLLTLGLTASDVSINSLLGDGEKISFFQWKYLNNDQLELTILNSPVQVNLKYLNGDIKAFFDNFSKH